MYRVYIYVSIYVDMHLYSIGSLRAHVHDGVLVCVAAYNSFVHTIYMRNYSNILTLHAARQNLITLHPITLYMYTASSVCLQHY